MFLQCAQSLWPQTCHAHNVLQYDVTPRTVLAREGLDVSTGSRLDHVLKALFDQSRGSDFQKTLCLVETQGD